MSRRRNLDESSYDPQVQWVDEVREGKKRAAIDRARGMPEFRPAMSHLAESDEVDIWLDAEFIEIPEATRSPEKQSPSFVEQMGNDDDNNDDDPLEGLFVSAEWGLSDVPPTHQQS